MTTQLPSYHGIDSRARASVTLCGSIICFRLSFRDVEDLLAQRGITVTY